MRSLTLLNTIGARSLKPAILGGCVLLFSGAMTRVAQAATEPQSQHATADPADQNKQLLDQIAELRAQVAKLQAATQAASGKTVVAKPGMKMPATKPPAMGMMDDKGEMGAMPSKAAMSSAPGAMKDDGGEMAGMPGAAQSSAPAAAMGMCCMGEMGGMSSGPTKPAGGMAGMSSGTSSAMPGQPGASHLYHIGSTEIGRAHV